MSINYDDLKFPTRQQMREEIERLKAEVWRLREALEHCKNRPHEHNPPKEFTVTRCDVIDKALEQTQGDKENSK